MFEYLQPHDGPVFDGLEKSEIVFAKDQPEYLPLRCLRGKGRMGAVLSRWSPTEEQRRAIAEGADIILELSTFGGPLQPIRMAVAKGEIDPDWVRVCLLDMPAEKAVKDDVVYRPDGSEESAQPPTITVEQVKDGD